MNFVVGQQVILINGKIKTRMGVLGQVKDYVALYDDNCIEVFTINHYNGVEYLVPFNDGGSSVTYKFKIKED